MKTKQCCLCGSVDHNVTTCQWNKENRKSVNHAGWGIQTLDSIAGWICVKLVKTRAAADTLLAEFLVNNPKNEFRVYEELA